MSFTVENPLVYFIQMVVSCGALSLPHHSGSHHIGDSRRGKQSTHGDPKGFHEKWWIIAVFLAALIGQSLKNSLTDCQFFLQIPENDAKRYQRKRSACGPTRQKSGHSNLFSSFLVRSVKHQRQWLLATLWVLWWYRTVKIRLIKDATARLTLPFAKSPSPIHTSFIGLQT